MTKRQLVLERCYSAFRYLISFSIIGLFILCYLNVVMNELTLESPNALKCVYGIILGILLLMISIFRTAKITHYSSKRDMFLNKKSQRFIKDKINITDITNYSDYLFVKKDTKCEVAKNVYRLTFYHYDEEQEITIKYKNDARLKVIRAFAEKYSLKDYDVYCDLYLDKEQGFKFAYVDIDSLLDKIEDSKFRNRDYSNLDERVEEFTKIIPKREKSANEIEAEKKLEKENKRKEKARNKEHKKSDKNAKSSNKNNKE